MTPVIIVHTLKRTISESVVGRWNKEKQVWDFPYKDVIERGLEARIVQDAS